VHGLTDYYQSDVMRSTPYGTAALGCLEVSDTLRHAGARSGFQVVDGYDAVGNQRREFVQDAGGGEQEFRAGRFVFGQRVYMDIEGVGARFSQNCRAVPSKAELIRSNGTTLKTHWLALAVLTASMSRSLGYNMWHCQMNVITDDQTSDIFE
jgi:hypothetical protein